VFARYTKVDGASSFDDCWLSSPHQLGCDAWRFDSPITLLRAQNVTLGGHVSHTLTLQLAGASFRVLVDGKLVARGKEVQPLGPGKWGPYVGGRLTDGTVLGSYTRLVLLEMSAAQPPGPHRPPA
jgi:hypothetical protein